MRLKRIGLKKKMSNTNSRLIVKQNEKKVLTYISPLKFSNLNFSLEKNSILRLIIVLNGEVKDLSFNGEIKEGAYMHVTIFDLSDGLLNLNANIELSESDSTLDWTLASVAKENDNKNIDVSFNLNKFAKASMTNLGVSLKGGKLRFSGIGKIYEKAYKASVSQVAKIIVYDDDSFGRADPILSIDCDDVKAMHSASVGSVDENALFYLTSRGVEEDEAKLLLTLAHLHGAISEIEDEKVKENISFSLRKIL